MPATAMDPGYGVPSIFDMARQNDVRVKEESLQEAERLLGPVLGYETQTKSGPIPSE